MSTPTFPLGLSDFASVRQQGRMYVDKSAEVATWLLGSSAITLFCRPRRFGKTMFLTTIRAFLDHDGPEEGLFDGLAIASNPEAMALHRRFPVISLSFKDVKGETEQQIHAAVQQVLQTEVSRHAGAFSHVAQAERAGLEAVAQGEATDQQWSWSLRNLTAALHAATGQPAVVLIDEYDTPILTAFTHGFHRSVVHFFRELLGLGLKDNGSLFRAALTGVLRVAREGLFSGLNHLQLDTVLDSPMPTAFGFTEAEVEELVRASGSPVPMQELRDWYNGYRIAGRTLYNPWSILSALARPEIPLQPWWTNSGSFDAWALDLIGSDPELLDHLDAWLRGEAVDIDVHDTVLLTQAGPLHAPTFLLYAGYLTAREAHRHDAAWEVHAVVPNRDARSAFRALVDRWQADAMRDGARVRRLRRALLVGDEPVVQELLDRLVVGALSVRDLGIHQPEQVFHAFALGLLVGLDETHRVHSQRESGLGYPDILVTPRQPGDSGAVMELKRCDDGGHEAALLAAERQIAERRYAEAVIEQGAGVVHRWAVAFDGKRTWVRLIGG